MKKKEVLQKISEGVLQKIHDIDEYPCTNIMLAPEEIESKVKYFMDKIDNSTSSNAFIQKIAESKSNNKKKISRIAQLISDKIEKKSEDKLISFLDDI